MSVPTTSIFNALREQLAAQFPERQNVIDGSLAAILAGEHVLMVGAPGTAKSALARSIAKSFGGLYFERLLTKFSTPDELFGPISLKALEQDRFERVIEGKLPTVHIGFVDEIFKSSSAILNSLLTLMNERLFHNSGDPIECPLITLFGASNELPEDKSLDALSDRFLIKFSVAYVTQVSSLRQILTSPNPTPKQVLTIEDLKRAQEAVAKVKLGSDTVDGLIAIRDACADAGIIASDRRWKASLKLVRACAYLAGDDETGPEHLQILSDVLWREPKERDKISRIVAKYSDPMFAAVDEILRAAKEALSRRSANQLEEQLVCLDGMRARAGKRVRNAIDDAHREVSKMHAEALRTPAASTVGLGVGVVSIQRNF